MFDLWMDWLRSCTNREAATLTLVDGSSWVETSWQWRFLCFKVTRETDWQGNSRTRVGQGGHCRSSKQVHCKSATTCDVKLWFQFFVAPEMAKDGQWGQDLTTFGGYSGNPCETPVSPQLEDEPSYSDDWRFMGCNPPWFLGTQPLVCSSFLYRLLAGHSKKEPPQTMVFPVFFPAFP